MFSSRLSFVLTAVGAAVGLGNVFRFPYLTMKYGLFFVFAYIFFLLVLGLPLLLFEISCGRRFLNDGERRKKGATSYICSFNAFFIFLYYALLSAFVLAAAFYCLFGDFSSISGLSSGLGGGGVPLMVIFLIFTLAFTLFCFGDGERIGKISTISVVFSLTIIFILALFRGFLFPERLLPLIRLDFASLLSLRFWFDALSQVFFSLSLGVGVLTAYGSLIKREESLVSCGGYIVLIDLAVSIAAGVIYASVGGGAEGLFDSFKVYPAAFSVSSRFGGILCLFFYLSLFFLCADSLVSYLKSACLLLRPKRVKKEEPAAVVLTVFALLFGAALLLFGARGAVGFIDSEITPPLIFLSVLLLSVFFGKRRNFAPLCAELSIYKGRGFFRLLFCLFAPLFLLLLIALKIFL